MPEAHIYVFNPTAIWRKKRLLPPHLYGLDQRERVAKIHGQYRGFGFGAWGEAVQTLLLMIAPSAPYISEELWNRKGFDYSIHQQPWPEYDPAQILAETVTVAVQVNGKLRARLLLPTGSSEAAARDAALADENVCRHLADRTVRKVIYVPDRLLNLVVV